MRWVFSYYFELMFLSVGFGFVINVILGEELIGELVLLVGVCEFVGGYD